MVTEHSSGQKCENLTDQFNFTYIASYFQFGFTVAFKSKLTTKEASLAKKKILFNAKQAGLFRI